MISPSLAISKRFGVCLRLFLLHELAKAILQWPGEPPCIAQVTPHEVAQVVETLIGYEKPTKIASRP